jgi:cytochrome c-type biogenesis protein
MIYGTAFWWGIVSGVFSPCMWAMFPIVLGYVAYETAGEKSSSKAQGFVLSAAFVVGMASMFAVLGALLSLIGGFLRLQEGYLSMFAGIVLIAVGLQFLGVYTIPLPAFMNADIKAPKRKGILGAVILGVLGAIVMGPCGISYLTPILAVALKEGRFFFGGALSFVYGIGHGLPLIFLGTLAGVATAWLKKVQAAKKYIDIVSGVALVGAGLYYLTQI